MNRFGKILFLSVSLVVLDVAMLMAMESGEACVSVVAQPSLMSVASSSIVPLQNSLRFVAQRSLCTVCLRTWGANKRQGCAHSFCDSCYESSRVGECPTCTEEANQCAICFDLFDDSVKMLLCGHMFCTSCIESWRAQCIVNIQEQQAGEKYEESCPACREPLVFKEMVSCEICLAPFENSDEITPPLVCKLLEWSAYYKQFFCRQQFAHRFHDKCFYQHYLQPGQHMSNLREHTATCPIHKKNVPGPQYSGGSSSHYDDTGHIKLPHILPERGGPQDYVKHEPGQPPNDDPPSPRTAAYVKRVVAHHEMLRREGIAPLPDWVWNNGFWRFFGL